MGAEVLEVRMVANTVLWICNLKEYSTVKLTLGLLFSDKGSCEVKRNSFEWQKIYDSSKMAINDVIELWRNEVKQKCFNNCFNKETKSAAVAGDPEQKRN